MKLLAVKMSSLGDIIHTFPAIMDAHRHVPDLTVDWVVERPFADIPLLCSGVNSPIVYDRLKWRAKRFSIGYAQEKKDFFRSLQHQRYDLAVDFQYIRKGAEVCFGSGAHSVGLDKQSINDPWVSKRFDRTVHVARPLHAIERSRKLMAQALEYDNATDELDFGMQHALDSWVSDDALLEWKQKKYWVFVHGTTWPTKHAVGSLWHELLGMAQKQGMKVVLPWYGETEREVARNLLVGQEAGVMFDRALSLPEWAFVLQHARGVIGVDTGLTHLAAALNLPVVALFGPTNPLLTGVVGQKAKNIQTNIPCSPCMNRSCHHAVDRQCFVGMSANNVYETLNQLAFD